MTQTPISKAIQYVKEELLSNEDNTIRQSAKHAIQILTDLLPYEREVIEGAYIQGKNDESDTWVANEPKFTDKSDYFAKTFTNDD